jgi:hypothetical protein
MTTGQSDDGDAPFLADFAQRVWIIRYEKYFIEI